VNHEVRGQAFGFHRAMDNAGAVLGPVLGALFLGLGMSLREIFAIALVPAVICVVLALALREPPRKPVDVDPPIGSWTFSGLPPSDRVGRKRLIVGGWLAYGVFYAALGVLATDSSVAVFALFGLYGISIAATEGAEKALVADLAPSARLGTAYGWFNLVGGALLLPASLVFGELYEHAGAAAAFAFSAGCALAASVLLGAWVQVPAGNA
jgi:MFS family permease